MMSTKIVQYFPLVLAFTCWHRDGFLDLQLMKGSLAFEAAPFKMVAFEITTGLSSTGWALLNDPDISTNDIYLSVSYTEEEGISATLFGSVLLGNLAIQVTGTKVDQVSKFSLVLLHDESPDDDDLMGTVHALSPASKKDTGIPIDAGLPTQLNGSLAAFTVEICPQNVSLSLEVDVSLPE